MDKQKKQVWKYLITAFNAITDLKGLMHYIDPKKAKLINDQIIAKNGISDLHGFLMFIKRHCLLNEKDRAYIEIRFPKTNMRPLRVVCLGRGSESSAEFESRAGSMAKLLRGKRKKAFLVLDEGENTLYAFGDKSRKKLKK